MSRGELSYGLPWLCTSAHRILRADSNTPVLLRGVNRSGLEYSEPGSGGFLATARITAEEIQEIASNWRANIIRVPFNQDWALNGRGLFTAEDYLSALDQVISWAASNGAYTLLDLHWLDLQTVYGYLADGSPNHVPPLPNPDTIRLWRTLASRYREEPAVLFDLFNEPHDPLIDDYTLLYVIDDHGEPKPTQSPFNTRYEWTFWAERLVREIRSVHPDSVIFVGGVDWAYDLQHIRIAARNIVYSSHVYSNRRVRTWQRSFGYLARHAPVFIAEWGGDESDLDWGRRLTGFLHKRGLGWAAWSWVDEPHLLSTGAPHYIPSPFGAFVRNELASMAT